jgi:hypothetical protein
LQAFRESYEEMFPGYEIQLAGGEPMLTLQRLNQRLLDCAILIDRRTLQRTANRTVTVGRLHAL